VNRAIDLSSYSSESIEIEVEGKTYHGIRFISGSDGVRQEVHFEDLRQIDPRPHRPRDVGRMRRMARVILRELVEQWKAQDSKRPVKVKPRPKPQRRRGGR
jgi:hypothetical protein